MVSLATSFVTGLVVGIGLIMAFSSAFTPGTASDDKSQQQDVRIRFLSMPGAFTEGSTVSPIILIDGAVEGCVAPAYVQIRYTATGEIVWNSGFSLVLCDPDSSTRTVDISWAIGDSYVENGVRHDNRNAMKADRLGIYELTVEYAGAREVRTFEVILPHMPYGGPQLIPRAEWVKEDGTVDVIQGSGNVAQINAGQDAVFDITLESISDRGADFWLQVFDADDPTSDFLKFARVYPSTLSLPDGASYTLIDDIVAVKPMSKTTARLVIHTSAELPPATYNIGVVFSTQITYGEGGGEQQCRRISAADRGEEKFGR